MLPLVPRTNTEEMVRYKAYGHNATIRTEREPAECVDLADRLASFGDATMLKITSNSGLIAATLLFTVAGCGTESSTSIANALASSGESGTSDNAASWCASVATNHPGWSLKYSVTSTLAGVDAWRAEQGGAGGFQEQIQTRFPALASLAPSDPLGVCLFVHAPRPIPQPPGASITADGTRGFVTPDGIWVEDAIGDQAGLLQEIGQIH